LLTAEQSRHHLLNLMRWRLEHDLGYRATHSFEMKNTNNVPVYNMIFATDNDAGERIMKHIYGQAAEAQPRMRQEARALLQAKHEEGKGLYSLFPPEPRPVKGSALYEPEPPTQPYWLPQ
jgi:hypothetical protein